MENKSKLSAYVDTLWLALGEVGVAALVSVGFLIFKSFDYTVVTGALLGGAVMVVNFLILSVGVNRAVNKFIDERGDREMTEEEAAEYAQKHKMAAQAAVAKSQILRNVIMIGALVLAGISGHFNILAAVIPLLMYTPILYGIEFIKTKIQSKRGE